MSGFAYLLADEFCDGNVGALSFFVGTLGLGMDTQRAINGFQRMKLNEIYGEKLYLLWNDCCYRDTKRAIYIMLHDNIQNIQRHINYENGRGIPYTVNEPEPYKKEEKGEWWIITFGYGHEHEGKCVKIKGTYGEARAKMVDKYGIRFAFQYPEEKWEKDWNDPNRPYWMEDIIDTIS
ncbi:hypothetical protein [Pseudobutyrivibrio sp.]|uniref:hypothetical protein n=1 Tax=Pseudobutyrivibrio sp. TaxID=2014367 RepID=UPI0038706C51